MNATLDKIEHDITLSEWAAAIASELQLKDRDKELYNLISKNEGHFELYWNLPADLAQDLTKWEEKDEPEWDGEWPLFVMHLVELLQKDIRLYRSLPTEWRRQSMIRKTWAFFQKEMEK